MPEVLASFAAAIVVVGGPLLILYARERTKNLAREATERALADYRHEHEKDLAALAAEHQKRVAQFGLYTTKRHEVYAALYARVREASDRYSALVGIQIRPDFTHFGLKDVEAYVKENDVGAEEARPVLEAYRGGPTPEAARLMGEVDSLVEKRDAHRAFQAAKNLEALNALYLSDDVVRQLSAVREAIARYSVLMRLPDPDSHRDISARLETMQGAVGQLLTVMRAELQRS